MKLYRVRYNFKHISEKLNIIATNFPEAYAKALQYLIDDDYTITSITYLYDVYI